MNSANIRMGRLARNDALQFHAVHHRRPIGYHALRLGDRPFSFLTFRNRRFSSLRAESCFVFDTSFQDS